MKILIAADSILFKTPDGQYWCKTIYDYNFWKRYLNVFNEITIISRCKDISFSESKSLLRVDGKGIKIIQLPYMRKARGYIFNMKKFMQFSKEASQNYDCGIFRLPSVSATLVWYFFNKTNKPYLVELVADPEDAYNGNPLSQRLFTKALKKAVLNAKGVSYVTKYFLQSKYPCKKIIEPRNKEFYTTHYSSIQLDRNFLFEDRNIYDGGRKFKLIHISNHINNLKGHKESIEIVKSLINKGYDIQLSFIGDGGLRKDFEKLISDYDLNEEIKFLGLFSSKDKIRELLINSDLLLFPTHAEGLPRVVIEAMAVSLPVISTNVNGIPELIEERYLFNPTDIEGMAEMLEYLINNPEELTKMSKTNFITSQNYLNEILTLRRNEFYKILNN